MALTAQEQVFIAWYRSLRAYDRMVIYGWLLTGDSRLLLSLWSRPFGGEPYQLFEIPTAERR